MGKYKNYIDPGPQSLQGWLDWLATEQDEFARPILLATSPKLPAACGRCYGAGFFSERSRLCDSCEKLDIDPLDGFVAISYSLHGGLESLLATTKKHYYGVKVWQRSPLAALVLTWFDKHFRCVSNQFESPPKIIRVPSATDSPDHLSYIWSRLDALEIKYPIVFDTVYRVIGPGKPARKEISPEFYRIPKLVQGQNFVLVDDIYTSGSQMRSVAAKLKEQGARKVIGVAIGRTLGESNYGNSQVIVNQSALRKWDENVCRYCESK